MNAVQLVQITASHTHQVNKEIFRKKKNKHKNKNTHTHKKKKKTHTRPKKTHKRKSTQAKKSDSRNLLFLEWALEYFNDVKARPGAVVKHHPHLRRKEGGNKKPTNKQTNKKQKHAQKHPVHKNAS
jgi:hypothetical protein